nr:hypothetical protein [Tanacetum cinerariifolium]
QPLPPIDSPTVEPSGYVPESDLEEDPEEYEDDETEECLVDYPIEKGNDGDDDDGESSGVDADDKDEEDEEKEEHLAPANFAITLKMASTQELIDAVIVALPSPPLLPPLYIPPLLTVGMIFLRSRCHLARGCVCLL